MTRGEALVVQYSDNGHDIPPELERLIDSRYDGSSSSIKLAIRALRVEKEAREIAAADAKRQKDFTNEFNVYYSSLDIGVDYYEASGQLPNSDALLNLHINGYSPHPNDVYEVFDDENDYQAHVLLRTEEERIEKNKTKQTILRQIAKEVESGVVPPEIFLSKETIYSKKRNNKGKKAVRKVLLTDKAIDEEETILRYARYQIAKSLIADTGRKRTIDLEQRRIDIAVNVSSQSGKPLKHTFLREILSSNSQLESIDAVKRTPVYQEWSEVIEDDRGKYLKEVLGAAQSQSAEEYYYDETSAQLILVSRGIGQIATSGFMGGKRLYLQNMQKQDQLVLLHPDQLGSSPKVQKIENIITNVELDIKVKQSREKYRKWRREDFLSYGQFILGLHRGDDIALTREKIDRLHGLGVGPSHNVLVYRFGSLEEYYNQLRYSIKTPPLSLHSMEFEDYVAYAKEVAELNDGKVNLKILRAHYQKQRLKNIPSVWMIQQRAEGGLIAVLEAAGQQIPNKKMTKEEVLDKGIEFYEQNGKIPSARDINASTLMPSRAVIYRIFGSTKNFQTEIAAELISRQSMV